MTPLRVNPLPTLRAIDEPDALVIEREGFVDEAAISALMSGPLFPSRQAPYPEDLALAAGDLDFAGWKLSPPPHPRLLETPFHVQPRRRPAPPVIEEPGLGLPHSGSHRWWLAGLAGLLSTLIFSLLLLNLAVRRGTQLEVLFTPRAPATSQPIPAVKAHSLETSAELTRVSTASP
ncbi:MAG: hypothetical protein ABI600_10425 [Luteolibacter sp.]